MQEDAMEVLPRNSAVGSRTSLPLPSTLRPDTGVAPTPTDLIVEDPGTSADGNQATDRYVQTQSLQLARLNI
jgi:hypothetical protein